MGAVGRGGSRAAALLALLLCAGCYTTVDSLGYDTPGATGIKHLSGPATYPNAFRDVLGKSDAEIADRIGAAFAQLFHGDPTSQAIYVVPAATPDQAYIADTYHGDIRTEGVGLGMMIAVQLDKRDEFDHLWRYAKSQMQVPGGAAKGYFNSRCDLAVPSVACLDPYGMEEFLMALLLANDRWAAGPQTLDYASDASTLVTVMRHKQDQNGGIVDDVTNVFDAKTGLPFDLPNTESVDTGRPSVVTPGYYELWAQATGDPFWKNAATSARAYWTASAHPTTGLLPTRSHFDGTPIPPWDVYAYEGYRAQINMTIDAIWFGTEPWIIGESDKLMQFFAGKGVDMYCRSYSLDGTMCLDTAVREPSLVAVNGVTASIATAPVRATFIQAVWNLPIPIGPTRYYGGILELISLLILGGQYRVY